MKPNVHPQPTPPRPRVEVITLIQASYLSTSMAAEVVDKGAGSWPSGLRVLVVESNSVHRSIVEQLLLQCNYRVISCRRVEEAISLVLNNQQTVDLVLSDIFWHSEDGLLILKTFASKLNIPVVMMSGTGETSAVMKYIANGACDFLVKPVRMNELKNIWQHVFRKQIREQINHDFNPEAEMNTSCSSGKRNGDLLPSSICENDELVTSVGDLKRARLHWSKQLHCQFVTAVNKLGLDKAVPKKILEIMQVQQLTREQVASHLQKYKSYLEKLSSRMPGYEAESSSSNIRVSQRSEQETIPSDPTSFQRITSTGTDDIRYHEADFSSGLPFSNDDLSNYSSQILDEFNGVSSQEYFEQAHIWDLLLR